MNYICRYVFVFSFVFFLLGCENRSDLPDDPPVLTRIDITPIQITKGMSDVTLAAGNTQPFVAVGHYADGTSKKLDDLAKEDWQSSDVNVGFFDTPGVLTGGNTPGVVNVNVTKGDITSNTINVNVTSAVIIGITVTPPVVKMAKGQTKYLTAEARYSDTTSTLVTDSVEWDVLDDSIVKITDVGLLSGMSEGETTLLAKKDGIVSNTVNLNITGAVIEDITVSPQSSNIASGQTVQLTANAVYSDNPTPQDVSNQVSWQSSDDLVATVSTTGVITGNSVGSAQIIASNGGVDSSAVTVNVTPAIPTQVTVNPSSVNVAKGQTQQLSATVNYSDGKTSDTTPVLWLTDDATIASVLPDTGLLRAEGEGNTKVRASVGNVISAPVDVSVTAAVITAISITPSPINVTEGKGKQLTATATFSDNTSSPVTDSVTWDVENQAKAIVTPLGEINGLEIGNTTLVATKDSIPSDPVNIEVMCYTADKCVDVVNINGSMFTSSPSNEYRVLYNLSASGGFPDVDGAIFNIYDRNTAPPVCTNYNNITLKGRSNWRIPTISELRSVYSSFGNMYEARGWPVLGYYRTTTDAYSLEDGDLWVNGGADYISCISTP